MQHFAVVGDVMGDVMGDEEVEGGYYDPAVAQSSDVVGYSTVVGYTPQGYPIVSGAAAPRRGGQIRVHKPAWRGSQVAPGVIAPDQGMLSLPMGNNTFTATAQTYTFQGQIQKPFRGERFLSRVVRTGTSATGTLLALIFVGTDLAQLDTTEVDLESLSDKAAFGVRLTMKPAQPGIFIRAKTILDTVITSTDTIKVSLQLLGRAVH